MLPKSTSILGSSLPVGTPDRSAKRHKNPPAGQERAENFLLGGNMIKSIETHYKGYRFRSRLEARWAVFFDACGLKWEYEKEGYELENGEKYLPDFWFDLCDWDPGFSGLGNFVEIKPTEPNEQEREKLRLLAKGTKHTVMCFWGKPGETGWYATAYKGLADGEKWLDRGEFSMRLQCFVSDEEKKIHHTPFGYSWLIFPDEYKKISMERAFTAFLSARFEFGEAG
jgi:hypothetical protein